MFSKYVGRLQGDWPYRADRTTHFLWLGHSAHFDVRVFVQRARSDNGHGGVRRCLYCVIWLSRTELSSAYMLGTIGSALFLTKAGRLYDQLGARIMLTASALGLRLRSGVYQ